jgi:hypothetical protein
VPQAAVKFVRKTVTRPAAPVPQGIAALDHEVLIVPVVFGNHPVKGQAVVKGLSLGIFHFALGKGYKVTYGKRRFLKFQPDYDIPPAGADPGKKPVSQAAVPGRRRCYVCRKRQQSAAD